MNYLEKTRCHHENQDIKLFSKLVNFLGLAPQDDDKICSSQTWLNGFMAQFSWRHIFAKN